MKSWIRLFTLLCRKRVDSRKNGLILPLAFYFCLMTGTSHHYYGIQA